MDEKPLLEQPGIPGFGTSPRRNSGLLLIVAVLVGIILVIIGIVRFTGSPANTGNQPVAVGNAESTSKSDATMGTTPESKVEPSTTGPGQAPNQTAESEEAPVAMPVETQPSAAPDAREEGRDVTAPSTSSSAVAPDAATAELKTVAIPSLPYSILFGSYRTLQEAQTTKRELGGDYFSAYVSPVDVKGSMAQTLYGVSEDGAWYRVMIGRYDSKEQARNTLAKLMETSPEALPEIIKFSYAVECGRFLDPDRAGALVQKMEGDGFLPYEQTCKTEDGRAFTRILLGCFFSRNGAQPTQDQAVQRGYPCDIVER